MSQAAADRNLLFGILALQMDFIRRDALIAAMHAWVLDKAEPLGQILLDQGALSAGDHQLLDVMVQRHLEKHGHDVERSLAALDASEAVRQDLHRIADAQLHANLAQLPATPSAVLESLSTTGPVCAEGARFRIVRPHARGGLGEVFVARDGELNREVALKAIQAEHADHPESRLRFVREAEITGWLEHPGIVPVYALGQYADGRPYYAMRFIRGDSLKQAIEHFHASSLGETQRNLELRQLLSRFIAVCNAIAYVHSRGVIHRDLKPSNIMLGEFGETLVVDWGLAKAVGRGCEAADQQGKELDPERTTDAVLSPTDSELTRSGQALGTPAYMSPEQAAGRLDQLGPASDVYSLGATLYTLLTGQAPFAKSDIGEVLNKVQKGDFAPPRQVNAQVAAALEAICLKAMALQPQARYASAKALADDVEHWLADEAVNAHVEAWPARLGRWVRHHKGLVGSVAAVVAVGLTVAIAAWLLKEAKERQDTEHGLRGIAEDERAEAERQRGIAEEKRAEADNQRKEAQTQRQLANRYLYFSRINLAHRAWQEGHIARMDALLEQTQPQHTGGEDLRGFERNYLLHLRQASLLILKGHTHFADSVAFSPDGQRLASASGDGTVKVWDTRTGQESLTLKNAGFSVAFSPDGQRLASASGDGTVKLWDAAPVREGSELQRQALSYFRFVAETVVLKDDMIQQIRQTPTLSEPAREQALAFAKDYREIPARIAQLAHRRIGLGITLRDAKQFREAETELRAAVGLFRSVVEREQKRQGEPSSVPPNQARPPVVITANSDNLAWSLSHLGILYRDSGRLKEAETVLAEAAEIRRAAVAQHRKNSSMQERLAWTLTHAARTAFLQREHAKARRLVQEAEEHARTAVKAAPTNATFRSTMAYNRSVAVEVLLALDEHEAVPKCVADFLEMSGNSANAAYDSAGYLARCVPLAEKDDELPEAKRKELTQQYGERPGHLIFPNSL